MRTFFSKYKDMQREEKTKTRELMMASEKKTTGKWCTHTRQVGFSLLLWKRTHMPCAHLYMLL